MNWNKKLIIGMVAFVIFIMTLGAVMFVRNESNALIENDHYEKGQSYNIDYKARQNAVDDSVIPTILTTEFGITIIFPIPVKYLLICRRPSDFNMERLFSGFTDEDCSIKIHRLELEPGPWLLRIQYTAEDKNYLYEVKIMMP